MRIATWNINNINFRLPLLLAWLEATRPDVVALLALNSTAKNFRRKSSNRRAMVRWSSAENLSGV